MKSNPAITVDRAIAKTASVQHGVFTRQQAFQIGATRRMIDHRLETGRWERVFPRVYRLPGTASGWRQTLMAICLTSPDVVGSHRSAARLLGLVGFENSPLEVTVPRGHWLRRRGLIAHESLDLARGDCARIDGIPVTKPDRTLIDLAAVVSPDKLEEALDDAIRRGLVSLPRLRWKLSELARYGRPGIAAVRRVLAIRDGSDAVPMSILETRFLRLLRSAGAREPEIQYSVRDNGRLVAIVDFAYPEARIAIEVDGYRHHSGRRKWQEDRTRRNRITARGWLVFHVTALDLKNRGADVCDEIASALQERLLRESGTSDVRESRKSV